VEPREYKNVLRRENDAGIETQKEWLNVEMSEGNSMGRAQW